MSERMPEKLSKKVLLNEASNRFPDYRREIEEVMRLTRGEGPSNHKEFGVYAVTELRITGPRTKDVSAGETTPISMKLAELRAADEGDLVEFEATGTIFHRAENCDVVATGSQEAGIYASFFLQYFIFVFLRTLDYEPKIDDWNDLPD